MNAPLAEDGARDLDRLVQAFYAAAFHASWQAFRSQALERLCEWSGALAAAWLTRSATDLPGEFACWPEEARLPHQALAALALPAGQRESELRPLPPDWQAALGLREGWLLVLAVAHRDTPMNSLVGLVFVGETGPEREALRRAVGHLAQAGTLALGQFIRRDELLHALGRPSRGCAALIDGQGGLYVASPRFETMLRELYGPGEHRRLPFPLPPAALAAGDAAFDLGELRFRLRPEGALFLLHARRPHPLDALSPREQEIARALAAGKTFKSVARDCDIAVSTVANHASRIYRKLGIFRREELVGLLRGAG